MTKGIRDLREMQIGFQLLYGCGVPVTPTARVVGNPGMRKKVNRVFPTESTGLMSSHIISRYYDPWLLCEVPISTGDEALTYQQLPWYLAMGVANGKTGVGGGADKTWSFCPDLDDGDMPELATIRYGDNAAVWQTSCAFARQLVISGASQGSWGMEADIIGRDMDNTYMYKGYGLYGTYPVSYHPYYDMFFQNIAYPTPLETILGQLTTWHVDSTCTFAGAPTQRSGYLIDWKVTIPGFHPKFFQDGVKYYTTMGLASRALTFEATVEFDDVYTKHILWDGWVRGTPVYQRLRATGSALGASTYSAQIDMVTMLEQFETLDQRDGNDIVKFTGRTVYDVACAVPEWCVYVVNGSATLP